jgi:signal-transduction protein with cAMP-binding, CBS, and nucleotidyltransferase domain
MLTERRRDSLVPAYPVMRPLDTVTEAVGRMSRAQVDAVLIVEDGALAGIFTERDLLRRVIASGRSPERTPLATVMTHDPVVISSIENRRAALEAMRRQCCRHLPVVRCGEVWGMASLLDLLLQELEDRSWEARELRGYIGGSY